MALEVLALMQEHKIPVLMEHQIEVTVVERVVPRLRILLEVEMVVLVL
jgi:hypothetical protein